MTNQFQPPVPSIRDWPVRYAIHFTDGSKMDSLTLEGAMRGIANRYRVRRDELITETTEEKISVWLHPGELLIAEVFVRA
jgi:deoxyribodipyrimidine photolyase